MFYLTRLSVARIMNHLADPKVFNNSGFIDGIICYRLTLVRFIRTSLQRSGLAAKFGVEFALEINRLPTGH
jgi:hypothetical protein